MTLKITKVDLFNYVILFSVILCFFNEILNGITQKNYLDKVAFLILAVTGVFSLTTSRKIIIKFPSFVLSVFILSILYLLFSFNTLLSFLYEYFKIFSFLLFLPIFRKYKTEDIFHLGNRLLKLIYFFLLINILIVVLQFVFGENIIKFLGYSDLRVYGYEYYGRLTGFIHLGTLGPISLLFLLLNKLLNNNSKNYNKYLIVGVLNIFFSTSKISYVIFLIFILIEYKDLLHKYLLKIVLGLGVLLTLLYVYVEDALISKINQYSLLLENLGNSNYINLGFVEKRAIFINEALIIFKDHPFGLGFGTYGDSSSKFNPNHYQISKKLWPEGSVFMSDSAIAHYIAEQGFFYLLYLIVIVSIYFYVKPEWKKYAVMLIMFYLLNSMVTMGLSSGNWPILFSLVYGLLYYSKNYEKTRV